MKTGIGLILFAVLILTGCGVGDENGDSPTALLWTRTIGGNGEDSGYAIAVDASGHVYVTGSFSGTVDFDPGSDNDSRTAVGGQDALVTKFSSSFTVSS